VTRRAQWHLLDCRLQRQGRSFGSSLGGSMEQAHCKIGKLMGRYGLEKYLDLNLVE